MTGNDFELEMCEFLKALGYWALKIPKNNYGAQPFDVIAVKGSKVFALDCKVCSRGIFHLDRIEDNQWTAFDMVKQRTDAIVGISIFWGGDLYFVSYDTLVACRNSGMKTLNMKHRNAVYTQDEIVNILGRKMK